MAFFCKGVICASAGPGAGWDFDRRRRRREGEISGAAVGDWQGGENFRRQIFINHYLYNKLGIDERRANMSKQIRTSAKAVIIQGEKLLAIKVSDNTETWYILPGGGQESEEILPQTVEREVREETGIEVKCRDLLFVIEGVHGESFHRVDLVFLCDYIGKAQNASFHCDTNQVGFDWLNLSELNQLPLYPSKLRRSIMNYYAGKDYIKYLGNEEIGDPECLE